jgi:hypothetical protein
MGLIYAHADSEFAYRLLQALNARGIVVASLDASEGTGRVVSDMLSATHNACRVLLYLGSQASNASRWVGLEAFPMIELGTRRRDPALIAVILDRSPSSESLAKLEEVQKIDASGREVASVIEEIIQAVEFWLPRNRVFVCHSSRDREVVRQVLQALDGMYPNCDYWFDSDAVPAGVDIEIGIRAGVSRAICVLVFVTRNLADVFRESRFLNLEFELARERERSRRQSGGFFVIPIVLDDGLPLDRADFSWLKTNTLVELLEELKRASNV